MGGQPGKEQDATGPRNGVDDKNPSITLSEQSLDSRLRSETEASPIGGVHLSPSNLEQHNLCSEPRRSSFQQPPAQQPKCRHARHDVPAYEPLDQLEKRKHDLRSLDDRLNAMVPPPTNRRPSMVQRLSQFTSGMVSAITIIEAQKQTLLEEGMTAPNFAFGVINFGATTFVVGAHPEFYWLYFAVQSLLLLAARTVSWWQQKLQFYLLDFCWVFNYILCAISLGAAFDQVLRPQLPELLGLDPSYAASRSSMLPDDLAAQFATLGWPLLFMVSTGPLLWAVAATGNSLVFHSFEHTASMFIHASPMLAVWTLRWNADAVEATFPGLLGTPPDDPHGFRELFLPAMLFYLVWWLPYTIWLLVDGVTRKDRGYDTVFANFAPVVMSQLGITSMRCAAFSYMQFHAVGVGLTFAVATMAYKSYVFHTMLILLMLLSAVVSGARVYSYYMLDVYEEKLREQMATRKPDTELV